MQCLSARRCTGALLLALAALSMLPGGTAFGAEPSLANRLRAALSAAKVPSDALGREPAAPVGAVAFVSQWLRDPVAGVVAVEALQQGYRAPAHDPERILRLTLERAHGLGWDTSPAMDAREVTPLPKPPEAMPAGLRVEIQAMLEAIARAQAWRSRAFARLPPDLAAAQVWRQVLPAGTMPDGVDGWPAGPDLVTLLAGVDHPALTRGMLELVAASARLQQVLSDPALPAGAWRWPTPWGPVVIDTTGSCAHYTGQQPLLLVDVGGHDTYRFDRGTGADVKVLLDHGGDDHHRSEALAADASSATLGYALLWDSAGDDSYEGSWLAQGAALLGAAVHIDTGGNDHYRARGLAQGFAIGGIALLIDHGGDDEYQALTQAQASAGPDGLAVLLDTRGNDNYRLDSSPLVLPSAQLPDRNASLGQGAAFGWRARSALDEAAPGGLAVLVDLEGHDSYAAQVFAQGAGYGGGLGVLVDGGGDNQWRAAWYAMGAAAHGAGALFMAGGTGHDRYTASHSTSLGAAHDQSVVVFLERGGNDQYSVGSLGLGAAHDHSTALFLDGGGNDSYEHQARPCRAFGASVYSEERDARLPVNRALFMESGGSDRYPADCDVIHAPSRLW